MNLQLTIRKKLMLYMVLFLTLAVLMVTLPALYYFSQNMDFAYKKQATAGLDGIVLVLENYKKEAATYATFFSRDPAVIKAIAEKDSAAIVRLLGPLAKEGHLDSVTISDEKGMVLARTHDSKTGDSVMNQANVKAALAGTITSAIESGTVVRLSVRAGAPVRNEQGHIIGVITPGFTVSTNDIVDRAKELYGVETTLFLGDERVATTFVKDGTRAVGTKLDPTIAEIVLNQGKNYLGKSIILGNEYMTSYAPLLDGNKKPFGIVFAGLNTAELTSQKNSLIAVIGSLALVALGICAFFTFLLARSLTNPLRRLVSLVEKVATGDLTQKMTISSQDEIGSLGNNFNSMVDQLRTLVLRVSHLAETLAAASEELTASAEQAAESSHQVAHSITDIASGAVHQGKSINETTVIVGQMSSDVKLIVTGANTVSTMVHETVNAATEGALTIKTTISQMALIESSVNSSAQIISKLGDQSQQIGQIIGTIAGIAKQTNLLALNAAIEAARAGEQGRGFAVVADEVRKLAEQTNDSAQQVATLIHDIQQGTSQAVSSITKGTQDVNAGTKIVHTAGEAFQSITNLVDQVSVQIKEMSGAMIQLSTGSEHVGSAIQQIEGVSTSTMGQTQTVSAATQEQAATMEEISVSSRSLANLASELQETASHFKL